MEKEQVDEDVVIRSFDTVMHDYDQAKMMLKRMFKDIFEDIGKEWTDEEEDKLDYIIISFIKRAAIFTLEEQHPEEMPESKYLSD